MSKTFMDQFIEHADSCGLTLKICMSMGQLDTGKIFVLGEILVIPNDTNKGSPLSFSIEKMGVLQTNILRAQVLITAFATKLNLDLTQSPPKIIGALAGHINIDTLGVIDPNVVQRVYEQNKTIIHETWEKMNEPELCEMVDELLDVLVQIVKESGNNPDDATRTMTRKEVEERLGAKKVFAARDAKDQADIDELTLNRGAGKLH